MKSLISLLIFVTLLNRANSQDYFEDLKGTGNSILLNGGDGKLLFSSRLNIGDNSAKVNLYRQYLVHENGFETADFKNRNKFNIGWGAFVKAKIENGLGSLFGGGHIAPGYTGSAYLSIGNKIWHNKNDIVHFSSWAIILSGTYSGSEFQLYDQTTDIFSDQLIDTIFKSAGVGLSFIYQLHPDASNVYLGFSAKYSKANNFNKLDKVDIKNDSIYTSGGTIRTITIVNENGNTYGVGNYKEYNNLNLRLNTSYVPGFLNNEIGFVFYPSIDISKVFAPKYNLGFSFNLLKKGSPSTSQAALLIEFNDLNNAAKSKKTFFKRSFSIGFTIAFNVITGNKE